jgi:HD-GYP domain-containing protein (c-di-GMP phosphodiesterase class II)
MESRVLARADCFSAMGEERHRSKMKPEAIVAALSSRVPEKLDSTCFAALERVVAGWAGMGPL